MEEICKCLISQYLLLSKEDLELWDCDPEQYGNVLRLYTVKDKTALRYPYFTSLGNRVVCQVKH